MEKIAETTYSAFYRYKADIIYSEMKIVKKINIDDIKESASTMRSFIPEGEKILYIADISKLKGMDRDAREFSEKDGVFIGMIAANAILVSNAISKMVGNFLIGWNKGAIPIKLFTDINKAVEWLRSFKKEEVV